IANCGFGDLPGVEFTLQEQYPWLMGEFVWSGFDYHGEPDPYEDMWPAHSSYFGIVDMCGFKKDRFYLYQSQWTDEPMIHILPHWNWEGREGEITPVYCYTNCDSAELFVNGESLGRKFKQKGVYRLIWDNVKYEPGSIKAPDRSEINADGTDLSFIAAKIVDKDGNLCPRAGNQIEFNVEGHADIAAVGNGNPISHESYQARYREAFNGLCLILIRSRQTPGEINITASSEGLESASLVVTSEIQ
ncbi:MAG: DUF4982 domain-containing protein, partial [Planctomycetota bacterium]